MMLGLVLRSAGGRLDWLPTSGYCPLSGHATLVDSNVQPTSAPAAARSTGPRTSALPWITFALLFLALYTRMIRASVAETIHEDFVRTAHAKGASETRVLRRHVLPNASLRVLTMVGMEIGTAIGVCIYIEAAYNMQGLGNAAINILGGNSDLNLPDSVAIVVLITLIVIIGNLLVDLLYTILDPRIAIGNTNRTDKEPRRVASSSWPSPASPRLTWRGEARPSRLAPEGVGQSPLGFG